MGAWSVPWSHEDKAKAFAKKMDSPWMIQVQEEDGDFFGELDSHPSCFWEQDSLVGNDHLADLISDKVYDLTEDLDAEEGSEKELPSFDARPMVKESLLRELEHIALQPRLPEKLEAVNIVREALGLEPIREDRELQPFQKLALQILEKIKTYNLGPSRSQLDIFPVEAKSSRKIFGLPEELADKVIYFLVFETKEQKDLEFDLSEISHVKMMSPQRPGLIRIYFTEEE